MKIKLPEGHPVGQVAEELLRLSVNLRHHTTQWNNSPCYARRVTMQYWEEKMDDFLEQLKSYSVPENTTDAA